MTSIAPAPKCLKEAFWAYSAAEYLHLAGAPAVLHLDALLVRHASVVVPRVDLALGLQPPHEGARSHDADLVYNIFTIITAYAIC